MEEYAELHAHLSTSINPSIYWQIAHAQGFKLPKREYQDFINYITLSPQKKMQLNDYFNTIYHPLLNKLSSGTYAVEKATYEILSGAYRSNSITLLEIRNNPMKHNHEGQEDLDHIIMAMLRGMERALLEYEKLSAGLIFCMAREFINPSRIGHGILAAYDKKLMKELVKRNIVLEICPLSNIVTKAVKNIEELKFILRTFVENKVKFCINSDWPETIESAHLWEQFEFLKKNNILSDEELKKCNQIAFKSSFVPGKGLSAYL